MGSSQLVETKNFKCKRVPGGAIHPFVNDFGYCRFLLRQISRGKGRPIALASGTARGCRGIGLGDCGPRLWQSDVVRTGRSAGSKRNRYPLSILYRSVDRFHWVDLFRSFRPRKEQLDPHVFANYPDLHNCLRDAGRGDVPNGGVFAADFGHEHFQVDPDSASFFVSLPRGIYLCPIRILGRNIKVLARRSFDFGPVDGHA